MVVGLQISHHMGVNMVVPTDMMGVNMVQICEYGSRPTDMMGVNME